MARLVKTLPFVVYHNEKGIIGEFSNYDEFKNSSLFNKVVLVNTINSSIVSTTERILDDYALFQSVSIDLFDGFNNFVLGDNFLNYFDGRVYCFDSYWRRYVDIDDSVVPIEFERYIDILFDGADSDEEIEEIEEFLQKHKSLGATYVYDDERTGKVTVFYNLHYSQSYARCLKLYFEGFYYLRKLKNPDVRIMQEVEI